MSLNIYIFLILDELSEERKLSFTEQPWLVKTLTVEFKSHTALRGPAKHTASSAVFVLLGPGCDMVHMCVQEACYCAFKMLEDSIRKGTSLCGAS